MNTYLFAGTIRRRRKVCTQNYVKGAETSSRIPAAIL